MGATIPDPRYLTLNTAGSGTVAFRGQRPNMVLRIRKITIECPVAGPGRVSIFFRDQLVTSRAIALVMSADGVMELHAGEEVRVQVTAGPVNVQIKITAHFEEIPL